MDELLYWLEELSKPNSAEETMIVLTIISIIVSGLALIFAILVPIRIANRQNKIDLFNKRYKLFYSVYAPVEILFDIVEKNKSTGRPTSMLIEETKDNLPKNHILNSKYTDVKLVDLIFKTNLLFDNIDTEKIKNLIIAMQSQNNIAECVNDVSSEIKKMKKQLKL